jgi:hypothetical protein
MIGLCRQGRLDSKRRKALLEVRFQRSGFEDMVLRAQFNNVALPSLINDVRQEFEKLETRVAKAESGEELEDLEEEAESLARKRAYVCPPKEIADEGMLFIYAMAEWGLPREIRERLRQTVEGKLKSDDVATAHDALRATLQEFDEWNDYFDDYHETMWRYTWRMFLAIILMLPVAILLVHYPPLILAALFLAGMAGSCASVISKVPLPELRVLAEFEGYRSRILGRIGAGTVVSLIASAILGWGIPIPVQGETFSTVVRSCSTYPSASCSEFEKLFLLGTAMGFGFTERLVAHFEGPWFGQFRRRAGTSREHRIPLR